MPASAASRRALGTSGEDTAARWYLDSGFEVVARNWRCGQGELDLVVRRRRLYVFCEVKTRRGDGFGVPAEAVTPAKQARIRRLAARWLAEAALGNAPRPAQVRFDVVAILGGRIEVIEGAF
ncbi:MAG: YraN family protein [Actinomycetota bacterium]|nr:YraN family protein [Actinomycetota bacterium]